MSKKIALGKGISSLLKETPNELLRSNLNNFGKIENDRTVLEENIFVDVKNIRINSDQPRKIFKERDLDELANSIRENGIIQPLIVSKNGNYYELIAGERRLRAAKKLDLDKVPVFVKRTTKKEKMIFAIIENVQRSDLNCVEEALAYYQLLTEFKLTQEEVAKNVGKERSTVANFLRILKLPRDVINFLQKEELSFGHAKILASVKNNEKISKLANKIVGESLSVRDLENLIKNDNKTSASKKTNYNDYYSNLWKKLDEHSGFNFNITARSKSKGKIVIGFSSEEEFNQIFDYLMKK